MKQAIILLVLLTLATTIFSQETNMADTLPPHQNKPVTAESNITPKNMQADTSIIKFGNYKIVVIEDAENTTVRITNPNNNEVFVFTDKGDIEQLNNDELEAEIEEYFEGKAERWNNKEWKSDWNNGDDWTTDDKNEQKGKFKGHWAGIDLGVNNYLNNNFKLELPDNASFMDLNTSRSWNVNINFLQHSVGILQNHAGIITGMGFELSNYHFDNANNIIKVNGIIQQDTSFAGSDVKKSKFSTIFLTVPLMLECQIGHGKRKDRLYLSAGVIGGVKLSNSRKVVTNEDGKKRKYKENGDDLNLLALRYGLEARAGYKAMNLYARYYLTPLFEKKEDPQLYPFALGLSLSF